ncbi:MAG TPA: transaldolase [Chitinispirillaceae bacterium]|nr:transaldolase [Chitinispirillaceae bacterium]
MVKENPLIQLEKHGQSIWLDYIRRDLIVSGELRRLIRDDDLRGMTSNPSIFEKAIVDSKDYDADIQSMADSGMDAKSIYEALSQHDVKMAADEFRPVYDNTVGNDGYVSLEVNPYLAHDTKGTIEEARRLWSALDRPNVFIKVPATIEGLPAISQLISEGINVNVTLLFGLPRYREVAQAYIDGIQTRLTNKNDVSRVASVASFFVSRIDTLVDPLITKMIEQADSGENLARQLYGQVAIASAKMAYQIFKEIFHNEQFKQLMEKGARRQRVLWASTGTKNPDYSDVKYIEAIIGPDTVNTVPVETLNAYRDHGNTTNSLEHDIQLANWVLERLPELGIDIDTITRQLEDEGVAKFCEPFDKLMKTLAHRSHLTKTAIK